MLYILGSILFFIFFIPIVLTKIKTNDNFHPIIVLSFLNILTVVPYIFLISFDNHFFSEKVFSHDSFITIEYSFLKFTLLQIVAYVSMLLGLMINKELKMFRSIPIINRELSDKKIKMFIIPAIAISILSYLIFLQQIGGLGYLLDNLSSRASFTSGNGYLLMLMKLFTLSILILIYKYWNSKGYLFKLFTISLLLINILMEASMGGRKSTIFIIIFVLIVIHYSVKRINLLKIRYILLMIALLIYFVLVPFLRADNGIENFKQNPAKAIEEVTEDYSYTIISLSYVPHYILIINHFDYSEYWFGLTYLDLLYSPIPSNIFKDKPPVDDGVYIRSLAEGMVVEPNTSRNVLYPSSWPPETFGAMYMNFGVMGLIFGFYLLGFIYKQLYIIMNRSNFSFLYIYIYSYTLLNFELSNLRIVQTISDLFLLVIFYSLLTQTSKK